MDPFTPEQTNQLDAWAIARDKILVEISNLTRDKQVLTGQNIDLADSNTEIETKINKALGRLEELNKKEEEFKNLVQSETAQLISEKTKLQAEIPALQKEIGGLISQKMLLTETINTLTDVHDKVFDKTSALDQIVEHVTRVSGQNIIDMDAFMVSLKKSVQEIMDKNSENVKTTNIVLEKLPKYIFELEKPIPIRRMPGK